MRKILLILLVTFLLHTPVHADNPPEKTDWQTFEEIATRCQPLDIAADKDVPYLQGDKLTLTVSAKKSGYLYVISVNEQSETTVLFPNKRFTRNRIPAGKFIFPRENMNFQIGTQAPFGKTLVVAFLSDKKLNLSESGQKAQHKSLADDAAEVFKQLSFSEVKNFQKSFGVEAPEVKPAVSAGKLELMTCETAENC
jgi:hypothetical protein